MPSTHLRETIVRQARRVVIKVGTQSLSDATGRLDEGFVGSLSVQIAAMVERGANVTLVSSGAIGAGIAELDLPTRPTTLPMLQATAAVGQGQLMRTFHDAFGRSGLKVAQILVTREDFHTRARYLNIRNTIAALADCSALPIINENDTVSVDEIRFGDNDLIAALVANMIDADLLVLLTDVAGFVRAGQVVDLLEQVDEAVLADAGSSRGSLGTGGMRSKLQAVAMVTGAGGAAVIAPGREPNVILRLLDGEKLGTVCMPAARRLSARQRWIAHAARASGRIIVDEGAAEALTRRGKSLLASGIRAVSGRFGKGATVAILDTEGRQIARGLTNYSAEQIDRIKGLRSSQIAKVLGERPYDEVVHRNNLALA